MTLRQRVAARVSEIRGRGQRLVQLNLELLTSELKEKGKKFGAAIGLFAAAGLFSLYAIGFLLTTVAVLLALVLPLWASLLIVTAALFALVTVLVLVGRDQLRKIGDPKPEASLAEAKATADVMKTNARDTVQSVRDRIWAKKSAAEASAAGPSARPSADDSSGGSPEREQPA
jgi:membrane protein implicated in regulation of membrane protease activity